MPVDEVFVEREIGLDIRDSVTMLTKVYCHCSWVSPRKPLSCYFVTWVASRFKVQGVCVWPIGAVAEFDTNNVAALDL